MALRTDMAGRDQRVLRTCAGSGKRSALVGLIRTVIPAISYWRWQVLSGGGGVAFLSEIQLNATTILLQLRLWDFIIPCFRYLFLIGDLAIGFLLLFIILDLFLPSLRHILTFLIFLSIPTWKQIKNRICVHTNTFVAPYFRNQLFKEMWHFGSFRVCSRAWMSLKLSGTLRLNGFDAHSQWGFRQMTVGLFRQLQLEVTSWPLVQKLWKLYQ